MHHYQTICLESRLVGSPGQQPVLHILTYSICQPQSSLNSVEQQFDWLSIHPVEQAITPGTSERVMFLSVDLELLYINSL